MSEVGEPSRSAPSRKDALEALSEEIVDCRACPRLVAWREEVARVKRRAFRDWDYWGRPVPGFGDPKAKLVILGLAPAAHGANRTGRIFTGDRSGDFLFAALHRTGFANQPTSTSRDDGLSLKGVWILSAARCAPPDNKPTPKELLQCTGFLDRELALFRPEVVLALGRIGWDAALGYWSRSGVTLPRPRPSFGHGAEWRAPGTLLLGSYHVSQQNTQTGRLTPSMFDAVLERARACL